MEYLEFCTSVRFNYGWNSLKDKSEYGIKSNEFSLYQLLVDQVSLLGLNLSLHYKLCEALAYVHGFAFCCYGEAGWNAIKEYFEEKNVDIDIDKMKVDIIKLKTKSIRHQPKDEFYEYIDEMFSDNIKTTEVKLVNECYRIIKALQPIKNYDINLFYELVEKAMEDLKTKFVGHNDIVKLDLNEYIPSDMPKINNNLPDELKVEFKKDIEDYPEKSFEECALLAISFYISFF